MQIVQVQIVQAQIVQAQIVQAQNVQVQTAQVQIWKENSNHYHDHVVTFLEQHTRLVVETTPWSKQKLLVSVFEQCCSSHAN